MRNEQGLTSIRDSNSGRYSALGMVSAVWREDGQNSSMHADFVVTDTPLPAGVDVLLASPPRATGVTPLAPLFPSKS